MGTGGCYSNNYKDCIPEGYTSNDSSCSKIWLPNGAQSNCVALWGDCTSDSSACCGPAECFGDNIHASCVPPTTATSTPTSAPTLFQTSSPSASCSAKDEPSRAMQIVARINAEGRRRRAGNNVDLYHIKIISYTDCIAL